ncbi:hypothetical protein [Hahella sp. HN01]|uniref:hypothetical protein n=1 Tax=Hahella sp. HN01 TaxID=2847262 RepID=UPI001C1F197A|nr:hypothetical protein [Hahella sp. HN01]MBU6955694.1 hypothetical protein [Hahella sp. HN01]
MRKCRFSGLFILLLSGCAMVNAEAEDASANKPEKIFELETYKVRLIHGELEIDNVCPRFELLGASGSDVIQSIDACEIKLDGYRTLDARTDFSFIEFSGYKAMDDQISYVADMIIMKGKEIVANCHISLAESKLVQGECLPIEPQSIHP